MDIHEWDDGDEEVFLASLALAIARYDAENPETPETA